MLSLEQIQAVRAGVKKNSTGSLAKSFAWVRGEDGLFEKVPLSSVEAMDLGSFQGRAGSLRRSRKGAVRRLPNGRRKFVQTWKSSVVSYLP